MSVVLVGQPFVIVSYMVLPVIKCQCERGGIVALMAQQRVAGWQCTQEECSSCHRKYRVAAMHIDQQGQMQFSIEMLQQEPHPQPATAHELVN